MRFTLSRNLAQELQKLDRIPAIRHLRVQCNQGITPPLRICRDIVDKVQAEDYVECDWGIYAQPTVTVTIGE